MPNAHTYDVGRVAVCVPACVRGVYFVARSPFPINALVPVSSRPQLTRNNRRLRRHRPLAFQLILWRRKGGPPPEAPMTAWTDARVSMLGRSATCIEGCGRILSLARMRRPWLTMREPFGVQTDGDTAGRSDYGPEWNTASTRVLSASPVWVGTDGGIGAAASPLSAHLSNCAKPNCNCLSSAVPVITAREAVPAHLE